ncbi:MAG: ATP-binding protein, partial [Rhodanobacter sp.]
RRVEKRLAEVTDNLPAVVYQIRRAPDGSLSFPFIAGDMQPLFGVTVEQATRSERDLFMRVHPEDQPLLQEALEHAAEAFEQIAIDFRAMTDQGWRWVRSRARPHHSHDGVLSWSGYWIDVTEARAQSEALVAAKAAADSAAAAKGDFLATMSHEIRTPMSGVLGMLEVLAHTRLDSEQQHVLETIEDSAQMLRQIIDDILDFSKIEAGALALDATPIQLRQVIDNVQQMLSAQAAVKQLRLTNHIDDTVGYMHLADGIRLRQILFNLLSNAIKFTERGGVTITLTLLEDGSQTQRLRLSVADTGIGISAEQQERLFRPFSQAEMSTSRRFGGTGLGLSICLKLVQLMGGEITLDSAPQQGTRVDITVTLPLVADGSKAHEAMGLTDREQRNASTAPLGRADVRVLVVEDHPTNQALMRWRMQQLGLACDVAGDGSAALAALRASKYDLVITDCRMPIMDGYAMTRELRREEANSTRLRLPVIALSASAVNGDIERCTEAGMDDFLVKPVTLAALRLAIIRWLPTADVGHGHDDQVSKSRIVEQHTTQAIVEANTVDALDKQALLQRFGSEAVVSQIVESLIPALREDIDALHTALECHDANEAGERLHRIIGGVGAIGADTLAQQARTLMETIEQHGVIPSDGTLTAFLQTAGKYVQQLDSMR